VTEPGGTLYVLCFSDEGPVIGPHPVTRHDLEAAFDPSTGGRIERIESDHVLTRFSADDGVSAWFATITRI
jgi:hypothetical protein